MQKFMFWLHSLFVLAAGALVGWFVQSLKIQAAIDSGWNTRFLLLLIGCGSLGVFFWFFVATVASKLLKRDKASLLQADAYSYFALIPLLSYQSYQRFAELRLIILGVIIGFILLKVIFSIIAYSGKMKNPLSFSYEGRGTTAVMAFALITFGAAHYAHQFSLASYRSDQQHERVLLLDGEARSSRLIPAGCSIEYEVDFPKGGSLWLAYTYANHAAGAGTRRLRSPKRLELSVNAPNLRKAENASVALANALGWNDVTIQLGQTVGAGKGRVRIAARGGTRTFSWPWEDPLSSAIAIAGPGVFAPQDRQLPNIIMITVDALRPDYIHSLGYDRPITPALDSLAGEGLAFPHAISASTWTIPSNFALLSSLPVSKLTPDVELERIPHYTLVDALVDGHYLTAAVTDGGWMSSETVFMNGFYIFQENRCKGVECKARDSFERAFRVLDSWRDVPVFLWIYVMEVHNTTWHPIKAFGECDPEKQRAWIDAYSASIESFDIAFGDFADALKKGNLYDNSIVLISSDHGNAFGELHNNSKYVPCGHGGLPYNEQIEIPIILKPHKEKNLSQGRVINEHVSNIDIPPTLLDLAGLPVPEQFEGLSLADAARGEPVPHARPIYSDTGLWNLPAYSVIQGSQKILYMKRGKDKITINVYDLENDPDERIDVFKNTPAQQAMVGDIEKFLDGAREFREGVEAPSKKKALSSELWSQLEELGYLNK